MTSKDIIARLVREGWVRTGGKGSHEKFKHTARKGHVIVPHPRKDLGRHITAYLSASQLGMGSMIYPAYVHIGDDRHAHGVTLPDFEGCFAAADHYRDLPQKIQEAIELHFEGEDFDVPQPSDINELESSGQYTGGMWMLVDIDLSKLESKPVRLNVSLPISIVKRMDDFASQHHLTRSALIVKATEEYLEAHKD